MHFYNEAKRLLNGQEVKPSITNLQGLGVVYTWYIRQPHYNTD